MKKFIIYSILSILSISAYTQDLIVTTHGDSINCKITKIENNTIYYTLSSAPQLKNISIPISGTKTHEIRYYETVEIEDKPTEKVAPPHFRLAINGGFSYVLGRTSPDVPDEFDDYIKELRSGGHFEATATYFISNDFGLGVKYSIFSTYNRLDDIYTTTDNGGIVFGSMIDDIKTTFIGPSLVARYLTKENTNDAFLMSASLGYMGYRNDAVLVYKYKLTGNSFGVCFDMGYDISISKTFSLGFQVSIVAAALSSIYVDDYTTKQKVALDKNERQSLSRIDLAIGLRLNK